MRTKGQMTFLGFVGWYLGSVLVSLALLVGLLCLWSWKWHRAHAEEVRERAVYFAEKEAREDAWRHVKPPTPVRRVQKPTGVKGKATTTVSDSERQAARAGRCCGSVCYQDIRSYTKVH